MAHIHRFTRHHRHTLLKTASYYLMHMVVAAGVAYAVTGSFWTAVTLSLLEPTVQAVAYFFHEKAWARKEHRAAMVREGHGPVPTTYNPVPAPGRGALHWTSAQP